MSTALKLDPSQKMKFVIGKGPYAGQEFEFAQDSVFIGRAPDNDLILADDAKVSRRHAEIKRTDLGYEILNLSEKNSIYIDGEVRSRWLLKSGQRVVLGQTDFTFLIPGSGGETDDSAEKTSVPAAVTSPLQPKLTPLTRTDQVSVSRHHPPLPGEIPSMTQASQVGTFAANQTAALNRGGPRPISTQGQVQFPTPQGQAPIQAPYFGGMNPPPPGGMGPGTAYQGQRPPLSPASGNSHLLRGILVLLIGGAVVWYFMGQNPSKKKESTDLYRTFEKVQQDIQRSESNLNAYKEKNEKLNSSQYRRAQEHLVKGLRDYRQGQYGRARDSFRLVLNLDPENTVAKRYYQLSAIRFDELVKFHMRQGMSYKDKNNFRLCKASYANAMKMINNPNDPTYKEAEQYFRECDLAMTGRF